MNEQIRKNIEERGFKSADGNIFKFEQVGDMIEGTLINAEKSANYDNMVYTIKDTEGNLKIIFGTAVLESKMNLAKVGQDVIIIFAGTKENKKAGQSDIKMFEVYIK